MNLTAQATDVWLPYRRTQQNARIRLFCFPHAGGSASVFREWQDLLPPTIEVCAIQLPGRERRLLEKPFTRMDELAAVLANTLRPLTDLPCAFFGFSLGAAIAYETAWRLRANFGIHASYLYVCARRAPQLRSTMDAIYSLPEPAFKQKLRELGGTPEEVLANEELLDLVLPILRADFELNDTYVAPLERGLLDCSIHAFGGHLDTEVTQHDLDAWRSVTTGMFTLNMFPEGHFFLKPNLTRILREISPLGTMF